MNKSPEGLAIEDPRYFDRLAEVEVSHWWSLGMWNLSVCWLEQALRGRSGLAALDVGCGTGVTIRRLSSWPAIDSVVGLDPSPFALGHASRHGARLVQSSGLRLPFPDRWFDVVTCFDVLQHLGPGNDVRGLLEIRRVLKDGGVALIRANGRGWSGGSVQVSGVTPYRLQDMVDRVDRAGLAVERATYANCLPSMAQEVRGRLQSWVRRPSIDPSHPSGGGLRIRLPTSRRNRMMSQVARIETLFVGRLGLSMPFGHSTLVLARKPSAREGGAAA